MGIENFYTFFFSALFFIMTPGIDTVFVLNKSIVQGKRAGIFSTLGINSGVLVHTLFAALGLSIIVAESAVAFSVIKYIGAAYLVYLGAAKLIMGKNMLSVKDETVHKKTGKQNYLSGLITNTLNPKVALFFLAFFPQFINPEQLKNPMSFIVLGFTYALIGMLWFSIITCFAGSFSKKFTASPKAGYWLNKLSGFVFILMGLKIALTKK